MDGDIDITVELEDEISVQVAFDDEGIDIEVGLNDTSGPADPVLIKDQDENLVAEVDPGETYHVIVLSGIIDNGPPYSNSIIDNGN